MTGAFCELRFEGVLGRSPLTLSRSAHENPAFRPLEPAAGQQVHHQNDRQDHYHREYRDRPEEHGRHALSYSACHQGP
jgi:hypothetical protein